MLILKLAFLTCIFYLGIAIVLETDILLWARHAGSVGYAASRSLWFVFFGIIWLVCFSLAWHIVSTGIQSGLHR
jgi:hypothetical protein